MNNQVFNLGDIASALAGAGLVKLDADLQTALLFIGVAVALKVLVAVLNKNNVPISSSQR